MQDVPIGFSFDLVSMSNVITLVWNADWITFINAQRFQLQFSFSYFILLSFS